MEITKIMSKSKNLKIKTEFLFGFNSLTKIVIVSYWSFDTFFILKVISTTYNYP